MAANNALIVTDINFDQIKANLQAFLSSQSQFQDYDFEASGMQTILHLLAYNTYYNSIYTNMVANEMFLDSALIRNNVVSRAKMLGYTPSSARGARASLRIQLAGVDTQTVTIDRNDLFTSTLNGITYNFRPIDFNTIYPDANGNFIGTVVVREGDEVQETYNVNTNSPSKYIISNENSDTSSLQVTVQQSSSNTSTNIFTLANSLNGLNGNSAVYFLNENIDGQFEVQFGDGVLGKQLIDGNIVKLTYNVCNGTAPNGINTFNGPATLGDGLLGAGFSYTLTIASRAAGGADPESIEKIKFNAPKNYQTQDRAVTKQDYRNILVEKAPDLEAVSVWGGEENSPPIYGKVYICAKPIGANIVTDLRKAELVSILDDYNALTIEPIFVDATFLYIVPSITVTYNSNRTAKSVNTLIDDIDDQLSQFQTNELSKFNQRFYENRLNTDLAKIDDSIVAVTTVTKMQKRFIPVTGNVLTSYTLNFNNSIYNPHSGHRYSLSSSSFTHNGFTCYFDEDGNGTLRVYRIDQGKRVTVIKEAGTVDYNTGTININSIRISAYSGDAIKVEAVPASEDISTKRNQILLLADALINIKDTKTDSVVGASTRIISTTQTTSPSDIGLGQSSYVY